MRACLRAVDAAALLKASGADGDTSRFNPVVDGVDMPEYPAARFLKRSVNPVAILAGTNTDEGSGWVWPSFPQGMDKQQYKDYVPSCVNGHDPVGRLNDTEMTQVLARYPAKGRSSDNLAQATALITDSTFLCGTHITGWEYDLADYFTYRFNHRSNCLHNEGAPGVYHGMEIPYVFGDESGCKFTQDEKALSMRMQHMWTNFAKTLNPSLEMEAFPKFKNATRRNIVLQAPQDTMEDRYREDLCQFWHHAVFSKYEQASGGFKASVFV